jgi:hypothetical protein
MAAILLAGCATAPQVQIVHVKTDISCKLLRPRDWSVLDTLTSIQYRRQDNAAACTCPENKQKPECKA